VIYFDPHFQLPQIHQADLTVDQDLGWNTVLSVSWLGAFGRELPNFIDTNLPTPVAVTYTVVNSNPSAFSALPNNAQYTSNLYGYAVNSAGKTSQGEILRPNGAYGAITDIVSNINTTYNALVVQVQHRLSHNIQFQSSYTWSHVLDFNENNTTFSNSSSVLDPRTFHLEYGNGNQNIPNRVIATAIINSPWKASGWKSYLVNGYELSPQLFGPERRSVLRRHYGQPDRACHLRILYRIRHRRQRQLYRHRRFVAHSRPPAQYVPTAQNHPP